MGDWDLWNSVFFQIGSIGYEINCSRCSSSSRTFTVHEPTSKFGLVNNWNCLPRTSYFWTWECKSRSWINFQHFCFLWGAKIEGRDLYFRGKSGMQKSSNRCRKILIAWPTKLLEISSNGFIKRSVTPNCAFPIDLQVERRRRNALTSGKGGSTIAMTHYFYPFLLGCIQIKNIYGQLNGLTAVNQTLKM